MSSARHSQDWHLYLVRTGRGTLYTGIATDVLRRFGEHEAGGARGARSLRGAAPLALAYQVRLGERGLALRAEARLKRLRKNDKERIVAHAPDAARLLSMLGLGAAATPPREGTHADA